MGDIKTEGGSRLLKYLAGAALAVTPCASSAQQTTTYSYDALGRLIDARHNGGVSDGSSSSNTYDMASNRQRTVIAAPTGWSTCSQQNQACVIYGDAGQFWLVRYGSGRNWSSPMFVELSGSYAAIGCQDSVFGDPSPGVAKQCQVKRTNPTPWSGCSQQNQACVVYGEPAQVWQIRYGSYPRWSAHMTFVLSTNYAAFGCQDSVFGDPYPGNAKHCEARRLP